MKLTFGCIFAWAALFLASPVSAQETLTLIPFGANWQYLDNGSDQGTNWVSLDYDDTGWPGGPAQLGYGDGDEATIINSGPSGNRIPTTYFRHAFQVTSASTVASLDVALRRDDSIIVYLNGVEVFRDNMPPGLIPFNQYSFMNASDDGNSILTGSIPPELLVDGMNVIAAEIHQADSGSSDVSFDLELSALIAAGPPIIISQPEALTLFENGEASFTVVAAGAPPLRYQWDFNGALLADATNATLVIPNVTTNDSGIYRVIVENEFGTAVSAKTGLNVLDVGSGLADDFEPDINQIQWLGFGGEVLATNYGGSVSGVNSLWFGNGVERYAAARPLNTSMGGTIGFQIRFADGGGFPWEQADLPGEGVVLEYSNDGGQTWNVIGVYDTENLREWTAQVVPIPPAAQGPAVSFRWRQLRFSSGGIDHWALDDVLIVVPPSGPGIFRQPSDLTARTGGLAELEVVASGSLPLNYQWTFNGVEIPDGTNQTLRLTNVSTNEAGSYQVLVSNSMGEVLSNPVELSVVEVESFLFEIVNLSTNGAQAIEHWEISQDDHGGIVISPSHVLYNGQNSVGRFDLNNLGNGTDLGFQYNAMVSDLKSGIVYTLANGNTPIQTQGGTVTALLEINPSNGALTGNRIELSTPFFVPNFFNGLVGFFSGFGQIGVYNNANFFSVFVPTGTVLDQGLVPDFQANGCENGGFWGVVEQTDADLRVAYVQNSSAIVRRSVTGTAVEDILRINSFPGLSDMCGFTVSPLLERWYFHHEGQSIFRSGDETIGYADATLLFELPNTPPRIVDEPEDVFTVEGLDVTFGIRVFGSRPLHYQWFFDGAPIDGAVNEVLDLPSVIPDQSGGYQVVVSNDFGAATSRVAMATIQISHGRIGYYSEGVGLQMPDMNPSIIQAAFTPVPITDLVNFDLSTVDILMLYEQGVAPSAALQMRMRDIENWVNRGGKVLVHDAVLAYSAPARNPLMFGATESQVQALFSDDINILLPDAFALTFGPHGNLAAVSLDQGQPSATGYALRATLPKGSQVFFNSDFDTSHVVALSYGLGEGLVYFSTIPIGYLVSQSGLPADLFRNVYLPNVITFMEKKVAAGAPVIGSEPVDQFVLAGAEITMNLGVRGEGPMDFQWYFNDAELPGATEPVLVLPSVGLDDAGNYHLVAANAMGSVTSRVAQLVVRNPSGESFQISDFTTNNVQTAEIGFGSLISGARGALAVSASQVFYTGIGQNGLSDTVRLSSTDLSGGISLGLAYEALVSNLRTEKVYALAGGNIPLGIQGGVVDGLLELDDNTGTITTNRIALSSPILLPGGFGGANVGIFSGYDRMILHTGSRAYHISLPSGEVTDAGAMLPPVHNNSQSWAYWGVAEFFGDELFMVYVRNSVEISRTRVPDGMTSAISMFSNLDNIASISISPTLRRWYFQHEGVSQFGDGDEIIGFADVALDFVEPMGPPEIRANPIDQNTYEGRDVVFRARATGTQPLAYQWQFAGNDINGATNDSLVLSGVTVDMTGEYQVVVSNSLGTVASSPAQLLVIRAKPFRINSLLTSNSRVIDHNNITGDDRGGIAISPTQVFYNGDSAMGRFNATDLSSGAVAGSTRYDGVIGELETEKVYTFASGGQPIQSGFGGQVTSLIELNGGTGDLTSNQINLSQPINIPQFSTLGFFAGVGRVVLYVQERVYAVELPSGAVFDLGTVTLGPWQSTENWNGSFWGVAEMIDGVVHLAYVGFDPVNFNPAILRTSVEDSNTTVINQFANLSDMAAFTVSISRNRWYFHHEGSSQFGGNFETVGYADANLEFERPPTIGTLPFLRFLSEDGTTGPITFTVTDDETPGDRLVFSGWSTNAVLVPTNNFVFSGTGPEFTVEIIPGPNQNGTTRVFLVVTDESGKSSSAEMVVSVRAVNDPPSFTRGPDLVVLDNAGPQLISNWALDVVAGPPDEANQTVAFQMSVDNPGLFAEVPVIDAFGNLTFAPQPGTQGVAMVTAILGDSGGTLSGGINMSDPVTFQITVDTPVSIILTTLPAEDVTETTASLQAELVPSEYETTAWFEWGETTQYGKITLPGIPVLNGESMRLSAALTDLTPGLEYHYRIVATNELGQAFGDDETFTTLSSQLVIDSISRDPDGSTRLVFSGRASQAYEVYAAETLGDWTLLGEGTELGEGQYEFVDADSPNHPIRFYRIFLP